jgi:hypothetical protein
MQVTIYTLFTNSIKTIWYYLGIFNIALASNSGEFLDAKTRILIHIFTQTILDQVLLNIIHNRTLLPHKLNEQTSETLSWTSF